MSKELWGHIDMLSGHLPGWYRDTDDTSPLPIDAKPPAEPAGKPYPEMHDHNPKHAIGIRKPQLNLVPPIAVVLMAKVFELGVQPDKYGPFNWRKSKVVRSIYLAGAYRHLLAMIDGQDIDPESGFPHSAHVQANMAILQDATANDMMIDDRPTDGPVAKVIQELTP